MSEGPEDVTDGLPDDGDSGDGEGPGGTDDGEGPVPGSATDIDSVTLEVIRNACIAVAEEMNANLIRTGYSPNIKERRDCSCALFDADGRMISQAENMPVHLGAMPFSVAAALERYPPETLSPGDSVLLNDPFRGGAHLPDLTLVSPVFRDGEVIAYAANRAHHADIGGSTAGSVAADSTEIYQEGLRIPPVKFSRGETPDGEADVDEDILDIVLANVRTPDERRGDLRAQLAANATGRRRLSDLAETHGERFAPALAEIQDYSERRMRAEIRELPDGTYEFADRLDDDGLGNGPLPVEAAVTVDGEEVHVDFAGTAAQTEGPINAVFAVTASATYYAVRAVTDPEIPPNHGCYRPITIDAPEGSIVNPHPPAAVVGGNLETSQRVTDVVLGAFAEADPERVVAACQGTMNNVTFGGTDPRPAGGAEAGGPDGASSAGDADAEADSTVGDPRGTAGGAGVGTPYAFYETQGGGFGGRAGLDGMDGVHVHMSNTMNTPAEVLETAYPLRVERYELRPDSGGAGEFRGGLGLRRDIRVRGHTSRFSLLASRHESAPYGLVGGSSGATGAAVRYDDGEYPEVHGEGGHRDGDPDDADAAGDRLPAKSTHDLPPGTVVSVRTPGGGGYGDPDDRDPAALVADLELGKVTPAAVRETYGVDPADLSADGSEGDG